MTKANNGGPAFPLVAETHDHVISIGLTQRDIFAIAAMQGFLANPRQDYAPMTPGAMSAVAWDAWKMADAMLKAREVQE